VRRRRIADVRARDARCAVAVLAGKVNLEAVAGVLDGRDSEASREA